MGVHLCHEWDEERKDPYKAKGNRNMRERDDRKTEFFVELSQDHV